METEQVGEVTSSLDVIFQNAVDLYSKGNAAEAKSLLLQVAGVDAGHAPTLNALGVILLNEGDVEVAHGYVQRAIELDARSFKARNTMADILLKLGRPDEAAEECRIAVSLNSSFAEGYGNLGRALMATGKPTDAADAFRRASELKPEFWPFHYHLGLALSAIGQLEEAEHAFRDASAASPRSHQVCNELGLCLAKLGKLPEAEHWCKKSLEISPNYTFALNNLGFILMQSGQHVKALEYFRQAVTVDVAYFAAWVNIGLVLTKMGRPYEAIESFVNITAAGKESCQTLTNLAYSHTHCGNPAEAMRVLRKAHALDPEDVYTHSSLILTMNSLPEFSADDICSESREWDRRFGGKGLQYQSYFNVPRDEKRLKIGYVSPDFKNHVVSSFIAALIDYHDRNEVEVICYANVNNPDCTTMRFKTAADKWRDVYGLTDEKLAALIREDQIDILVDLAGHTSGNRLTMFAMKPAPLQVTWLGYPATTGLSTIDYRITDAVADPVGEADLVNVEKLIRLPQGFLCYSPPESTPDVSALPFEKNGFVTFGSFNRSTKISAQTAKLWGEILQRLPESRLLIKQKNFEEQKSKEKFLAFMQKAGVPPEKLIFKSYVASTEEHLKMYRFIDISLDTFPYNGTTTTCESLWMGVPVVTILGNRHAARVSGSILTRIGMEELIASSEDEYVETAVRLANNPDYLRSLRMSLRSRVKDSPLVDSRGFSRSMEEAYRGIWREWCAGQKPLCNVN